MIFISSVVFGVAFYIYGYYNGKQYMRIVMNNFITHRRLEASSKSDGYSQVIDVLTKVEDKLNSI